MRGNLLSNRKCQANARTNLSDTAYLEGAHFRLLRSLIAKFPVEHHISQAQVIQAMNNTHALLSQKRLQGHLGHTNLKIGKKQAQ